MVKKEKKRICFKNIWASSNKRVLLKHCSGSCPMRVTQHVSCPTCSLILPYLNLHFNQYASVQYWQVLGWRHIRMLSPNMNTLLWLPCYQSPDNKVFCLVELLVNKTDKGLTCTQPQSTDSLIYGRRSLNTASVFDSSWSAGHWWMCWKVLCSLGQSSCECDINLGVVY